eukprot:3534205-Pyramimonas_sp.AAC.1
MRRWGGRGEHNEATRRGHEAIVPLSAHGQGAAFLATVACPRLSISWSVLISPLQPFFAAVTLSIILPGGRKARMKGQRRPVRTPVGGGKQPPTSRDSQA